MQAEETVEIERGVGAALARLRNRDGGAHAVVIWFGERDDDVEAVHGAALEEHDHFLLVGRRSGGYRALQERWERGHAEHGDAAVFQEVASRDHCLSCCLRRIRVLSSPYLSHKDRPEGRRYKLKSTALKFRRAQHQA